MALAEDFNVAAALVDLAKAHGLAAFIEHDRAVVHSPSPLVFLASTQDGPKHTDTVLVQLNIGTFSTISDRPVWHSFAGIGDDKPTAQRDAFSKFVLGPFHPLLSAFGNHSCSSDGTEWSDWAGSQGRWRVCDSPLLVQGGDPSQLGYSTFLAQLRDLFVSDVAPGLHWGEVFFSSLNGQSSVAEVRLDNEIWPKASAALASWDASPPPGYRSGRHFFVALPA